MDTNRKGKLASAAIAALMAATGIAGAQDFAPEAYDLDGDGYFEEGRELEVLIMHLASPTLRKYDTSPVDGRLDDGELAALYAEARTAGGSDAIVALAALIDARLIEGGGRIPVQELNLPDERKIDAAIAAAKAQLNPECNLKDRLFLRRDKLDMAVYNRLGAKERAGASFALNRDYVRGTTKGTIDAAAAFVLFRNTCRQFGPDDSVDQPFAGRFSLAAYADLSGSFGSDPTLRSRAEFGLDGQLELQGGLFRHHYLTLGTYAFTDFQATAFGYGATASWQPTDERLHMGITRRGNPWIEWYWTPIVRLDALSAVTGGNTGLASGTNYVWFGGDLSLTANLLPEKFDQRLFVKGTAELYWDLLSGRFVQQYGAGVHYNLDDSGTTSVSIEYSSGTSRKSLAYEQSLLMRLNLKH